MKFAYKNKSMDHFLLLSKKKYKRTMMVDLNWILNLSNKHFDVLKNCIFWEEIAKQKNVFKRFEDYQWSKLVREKFENHVHLEDKLGAQKVDKLLLFKLSILVLGIIEIKLKEQFPDKTFALLLVIHNSTPRKSYSSYISFMEFQNNEEELLKECFQDSDEAIGIRVF